MTLLFNILIDCLQFMRFLFLYQGDGQFALFLSVCFCHVTNRNKAPLNQPFSQNVGTVYTPHSQVL